MEKTVYLPGERGSITYRIPDVIDQLRFFSDSKWYSEDSLKDFVVRTIRGLEAAKNFIVKVEGVYECFDDVMKDRTNLHCLWDIVNDLGGVTSQVTEEGKKPSDSAPST